ELLLGEAITSHPRDTVKSYKILNAGANCSTVDLVPALTLTTVCNRHFGCIEAGDICVIANPTCDSGVIDPVVISAPD
ncbi:MAG: hypothetical protein ABFS30_00945, partial [Pseudomonadota bacterium]